MSLTERDAKRPRVTLIAKSQAQEQARSAPRHGDSKGSSVSVAEVIEDLEALLEPRGAGKERAPAASPAPVEKSRLRPPPATQRPRSQGTVKKASLIAVGKKPGVNASPRQQADSPPLTARRQEPAVTSSNGSAPAAPPPTSRMTPTTRSSTPVASAKKSAPAIAQFDVCGQIFKISSKLILSQPDTLLAKLMSEASQVDRISPIAVDVSPDRFQHILDWYRYGELFLPRAVPAEAVLRDAAKLELPEEIIINGASRSTAISHTAQKVGRELIAAVLNRWPTFDSFFATILEDIDKHYQKVGSKSVTSTAAEDVEDEMAEESFDFPRFALPIFGEDGWMKGNEVCSTPRARVLALKLEELGYICEFTESELLVALPLKLRSEAAGINSFPPGGEEDGEEAK